MEETVTKPGYSADGYIIDQDQFAALRYRTMPSSINGCGWIAAYNLRRFFGQEPDADRVREELDAMHFLRVPGPTLMVVMREYLRRYLPQLKETVGREEALAAARRGSAGIFRYREGHEPHFVSFLRCPEGDYRFFNVADGLEDCRMSMERFVAEHCARGTVIVFTDAAAED